MAKNASLLTVATILARLSTLVLTAVMAHALGARVYGRYGLSVAIATMLVPVADLGLTQYLIRETARAPALAEAMLARLALAKLAMLSAVIVVVAASGLVFANDVTLVAAMVIVLAAALAESFSNFVFGYFQGRERMGFEAVSTVTTALVRTVGAIVLVLVLGELLPALGWMLLINVMQMTYASARLRAALRRSAYGGAAGAAGGIAWRSALAMGLVVMFTAIYLRVDSAILGWVFDERTVGLYSAAYVFMSGLQVLPWMTSVALAPVFARTYGRQDEVFERSWHQGVRAVLLFSFPIALVTTLLAAPITLRLFGGEFAPAASALAILVWGVPVAAVNTTLSAALRGARRERWLAAVSGVGTAVNVGLNLWAIPTFGIEGAAGVTVATEAAVSVALAVLARRHRILPWPRLPYRPMALSMAVLGAVTIAVRPLPVEVAVAGALCAYIVALAVSGGLSREDFETVRGVLRRRG